jgi:hypothetical protein
VDDGEPVYFDGNLLYCTSAERAGTVEFMIDNAVQAVDTGESQCRAATEEEGQVVLYAYGNGGGVPTGDPIATYVSEREDGNWYYFGDTDYITPGWYQLGFRDSAFATQEFRSDIFALSSDWNNYVANTSTILVYVDATPATNVYVEKAICIDPAKVETTDFFINQMPENEFGAAATTDCRYITFSDNFDFSFTLTNTDTHQTLDVIQDEDEPYSFMAQAVPAGTYTLTETFGAGVYTATSDEFTVDPAAGDPLIVVHNYTAEPFDLVERSGDANFSLRAFTCLNDAVEATYDYYFYPFGFDDDGFDEELGRGSIDSITGAAAGLTETCQAGTLGEYQFQLESAGGDAGVTAQETYLLVQDPEHPAWFYYQGGDFDEVPEGTYIVRELITGSVSTPVLIASSHNRDDDSGDDENYVEFYFYPAAPTPTVTPTATATATATPTEPGATATASPTQGTGWVIPKDGTTATATAVPGKEGDGTTGGGTVSKLPSTGQGGDGDGNASLYLLLGLALSFLLGAAILSRRTRAMR